jgi:hypothetical protein
METLQITALNKVIDKVLSNSDASIKAILDHAGQLPDFSSLVHARLSANPENISSSNAVIQLLQTSIERQSIIDLIYSSSPRIWLLKNFSTVASALMSNPKPVRKSKHRLRASTKDTA